MPRAVFERVLELARERGIIIFSDEVYRGLEHDPAVRLPAACEVDRNAISLGSVSKAHGLPGLRIGWLACRDRAMLERIRELKLYTTICSSAPSEVLVALALRNADLLIERSRRLILANLPLLEGFLERRRGLLEWVRPTAGPIGFPRVSGERDVRAWCERAAAQASVLVLPGDVYQQPTHVRLGFGRANLAQAIERFDGFLG
jgi:aspartate/methionine/tyrosine aminotransferase